MHIYDCKVNHLSNPLGFDLGHPVFSWKGDQDAYRLVIAQDEALRQTVYETTQTDPLGTQVCFPMKPRTRYYWSVGGSVQWFETAKLTEPWAAKWIGCDRQEPRHPIFSKQITLSKPVASARLYICGLGLYEASIDGKKVGDEYLAPFCNDYNEWVQYQTYDVTQLLTGKNTLSVLLGNGWYSGRFGFSAKIGDPGYYGNDWKLLAEVRIRYADGSESVIGTDESWTVTRSAITFSNIYDGEHVDLALPPVAAVPASPADAPRGRLRARLSPPVTVQQEMPVQEIIDTPAGETVLDIGQNMTGSFRLRVHIPRGQTVHLQFGELLQHGNFYRDNLRTALAEYYWTSDGSAHTIEPTFTFFGFRYVKVEGLQIRKEDFTALVLHSYIPIIGTISTGHALVNKLISNTLWGQRGNYLDVPTDCPQRDERMGWTGDAQVFAPTANYFTDCTAFFHKYLTDMNYEQAALQGAVPHVVPNFGIRESATAWGDAAAVIPWTVYRFSGDKAFLAAHYSGITEWVDYCTRKFEEGTWLTQFHFGDWLALDGPQDASAVRGGTEEAFIAFAYLIHSTRIAAEAANALGKTEDRAKYAAQAEDLLSKLHVEYYSPNGRCCVNTQTAHLLTLAFDLHPNRAASARMLKDRLEWSQGKLQTGFVGTPLLCPTLSACGMHEEAYRLLLNEELPGWLYEIRMGATTVWERWNSVMPDGSISSTGMNSLNHYSYGSIVEWLWKWAAGLECAEPGFRKAKIHPIPNPDLKTLDAEYNSASGKYEVHWAVSEKDMIDLSVTVPHGCEAALELPYSDEAVKLLKAGTYAFRYTANRPMHAVLNTNMPLRELVKNGRACPILKEIYPGIEALPEDLQSIPFRQLPARLGITVPTECFDAADQKLKQL